jgi:hypothetical protein
MRAAQPTRANVNMNKGTNAGKPAHTSPNDGRPSHTNTLECRRGQASPHESTAQRSAHKPPTGGSR